MGNRFMVGDRIGYIEKLDLVIYEHDFQDCKPSINAGFSMSTYYAYSWVKQNKEFRDFDIVNSIFDRERFRFNKYYNSTMNEEDILTRFTLIKKIKNRYFEVLWGKMDRKYKRKQVALYISSENKEFFKKVEIYLEHRLDRNILIESIFADAFKDGVL